MTNKSICALKFSFLSLVTYVLNEEMDKNE